MIMKPKGFHSHPRHLFFYLREELIDKNEFLLLTLLMSMDNYCRGYEKKKVFSTTDDEILEWGIISEKPLARAKKSLQEKEFIIIKRGRSGVGSEYKFTDRIKPE